MLGKVYGFFFWGGGGIIWDYLGIMEKNMETTIL